jgi:uncharacterized membrane protein YeaQ/YmgE (transglycosylase-associated protein family)
MARSRTRTRSNPLVVFLVVGLLIGALAGYLTRPEAAEIHFGPINIEVSGNHVARGGGELTSSQAQHIAIVTLIGGIVGLALGFAIKSGKIKV